MRLLALAAAVAVTAFASAAQARPWIVDKAASKVGFSSSFSGETFQGSFKRWDAKIDFDPKNLKASRATVSVDLTSAVTGNGARDEALPSSDWFSAKKHPRATFATRAITHLGGNRYQAVGDLTLRGVKRPVTLPFTLAITGDTAKMQGRTVLDRTAFGVGQGNWKSGAAVPTKVTVDVNVTARAR